MQKILLRGSTITKRCRCNFDPLKPHFYIVKLGFTGVYIIFLIFAQNIRLWVLVRNASPTIPTIYDLSRNTKNIRIFYRKIFLFGCKIFIIFEYAFFHNAFAKKKHDKDLLLLYMLMFQRNKAINGATSDCL